jgi:hypothetical protein
MGAAFDLIAIDRAVTVLANELAIPAIDAIPLLILSGIPTFNLALPGGRKRVRVNRADVIAYARHLAKQAQQVPVGGGPDIGYEADRDYRDGQDDRV